MPYSVMDEFEDLFGSMDANSVDTDSGSDDLCFRVSFDPLEELLNGDL